ncbi:MAG: hypothetical protein RSF67_00375 [Clostridia bacterium]
MDKLMFRDIELTYKGEKYIVTEEYYVDAITGEEYTTTENAENTMNQLYDKYNEKHSKK